MRYVRLREGSDKLNKVETIYEIYEIGKVECRER